jgi:integrase
MKVTTTWLESRRTPRNRPEKRYDETVDGREGLMVRVFPSGTVTFRFRYTFAGERRVMVLGEFGKGALSLADALDQHHQAQRELKKGLDPITERKRREAEAAISQQRQTAAKGITVRHVIAEWAWHYARRERKRPREAVRLLKVYLGGPWKDRPANELRRRDAVLLLDRIKARGSLVMANRIRDLGHQVFTFCVARELIEVNPFVGVPNPGGDEESKDRFLTPAEIQTFWNQVDAPEKGISRRLALALKLILVTAQRPGEVIKARFDHFDLAKRAWTIPPEVIKTVRKAKRGKKKQPRTPLVHMVPLTDLAAELVEELRALSKNRPCLLPAQRSKRNPDGHIEEKGLAHALRDKIDEKAETLFELSPFTPHDLRRTAATMMTSLGIPRHPDVAKILNHAEEDDDTTAVYDRWEYWPEKQKALALWEKELRAIITGKPSSITSTRGTVGNTPDATTSAQTVRRA